MVRAAEKWSYGGTPVDVTEVYTYLGLDIESRCNWSEAKAVRIQKSTRALFKVHVYRNLKAFGPTLPSMMILIFDSKIVPTLLYGAEIWGVSNCDSIVKFVDNFYRALLMLRPNVSTTLARGELGRHNIDCLIKEKVVKFWVSCVSADLNSAKFNAYKAQLRMLECNQECWASV